MSKRPRAQDAKKVARRITGFSIPFIGGGVSWAPSPSERDQIRTLLIYLEDRRALYAPYEHEEPGAVCQSVQDIRSRLTETLQSVREGSPAIGPLEAMRFACRRFLTNYDRFPDAPTFWPFIEARPNPVHFSDPRKLDEANQKAREQNEKIRAARAKALAHIQELEALGLRVTTQFNKLPDYFFVSLGELRGQFGAQLAILSEMFELEVKSELASIIPTEEADLPPDGGS